MRALVTGANGLVGQHLTRMLLDQDWEVCALLRRPLVPTHRRLTVMQGDLRVADSLALPESETGPIDTVFHLAALLPTPAENDSAAFIDANITATLKLIEACERRQINRFIYMSSVAVIGEPKTLPIPEQHPLVPQTAYALSKLGGEFACALARSRGMQATAFRLSSPYGPSMNQATVLPLFVRLAREGKPIRWHGSGSRSQDFIHVTDVARACILAATTQISDTYCLGSGTATSMRRLAEVVTSLIPGSQAEASGQPDPQEGRSWQLDISKARRDFGFAPQVSIESGLASYIDATQPAPASLWA